MKKAITILAILVVLIGSVFATTAGNTVVLQTSIEKVIPNFKLYYGTGTAKENVATKTVDASIADEGGVTASFSVWQEGSTNPGNQVKDFSRFGAKGSGTTVELTITCNEFYYYGVNGTDAKDTNTHSAAPTITAKANGTEITSGTGENIVKTLTFDGAASATDNVVTFKPTFYGKKVDNQEMGTFTAYWAQEENLPLGVYKADIVLEYTAQT